MNLCRAVALLVLFSLPNSLLAQIQAQDPAIPSIAAIMQRWSGDGDFSGAVLVARDGKILYENAFGYANREWSIANDLGTKFEIGSMTKQFTALLVLQFVNEGKIRLDGSISDYLPYYRKDTGRRVIIAELLSHTSGIPDFLSQPSFLGGSASRAHYGVQEFATQYCSGDLLFAPGTRFGYSNSGYFLLGAMLEQVSGSSFERLLQDRILTPLKMKDSGYVHPETVLSHRAAGYERTPGGFRNARFYDMSIPFAAGAMYSTVGDLLRWDQTLYTEDLLPTRLRDLLFTPHLEEYGFGWSIYVPKPGQPNAGDTILMHGGAIFGFQSVIERIPKPGNSSCCLKTRTARRFWRSHATSEVHSWRTTDVKSACKVGISVCVQLKAGGFSRR
jgi:CubicO group peptidase (beta-lactamase class C family)